MGQSNLLLPGNATPSDVRSGKTFSAGTNYNATGTAVIASGNATAAQLLTGYTASNASGAISGSMPNNGSPTWTPGTSNQSLSSGYYSGGTINGDANLTAANIKSGVSIFGVPGSLVPGNPSATGTVTSSSTTQAFQKNAGGTNNYYTVTVSGLSFTPSMIVIDGHSNSSTIYDGSGNALMATGIAVMSNETAVSINNAAPVSVGSGSFTLPVTGNGVTYTWKAYQ